jgi:hypothetical protein
MLSFSCSGPDRSQLHEQPSLSQKVVIFPDYTDIVVPPNIAPMNFSIVSEGSRFVVDFIGENGYLFSISTSKNVDIPIKKWQKLLNENTGKTFQIQIYRKHEDAWEKFPPIHNIILTDSIDPWLTYRLVHAMNDDVGRLSIQQRHLESFDCFDLADNKSEEFSCFNCHTPNRGNPDEFLVHFRYDYSGTVVYKNGEFRRLNTITPEFFGNPGSYPAWHPAGRFIAFSTGFAAIFRHADVGRNPVETYNVNGNIALLDLETNTMLASPKLKTDSTIQKTFANWSPDGKWLYFCQAIVPEGFDTILGKEKHLGLQYDLLRIPFDEKTITFGNIETIIDAKKINKSVSWPKVSPDGKYLLMNLSEQGTFSVWKRDADLYLMDLKTLEFKPLTIVNSKDSESYHSWSSNSRWFVVASKRNDGFNSLPYFSHIDKSGNASKPFLLPQKDPEFYKSWIKSFNVVEFAKGKVNVGISDIEKAAMDPIINVDFGWTNDANFNKK